MRALKKLRSWRPQIRSQFAALMAMLVIVGTGLTGALGFAGTAGALTDPTAGASPISAVAGAPANTISTVGPFIDTIADGSSGMAADWAWQMNDDPSSTTNTTWLNTDTLVIDVSTPTGANDNDVATGDYVEFDGLPIVAPGGGGSSGATAPTFTAVLGTNTNDIDGTGLTDQLTITYTNGAGLGGAAPFIEAVANIKYTVGASTTTGPITTTGAYTDQSVTTPIFVTPNAAVLNVYATSNTPPVTVLPSAIAAPISPISVVETQPGQIGFDPIDLDTSPTSTGYICVTAAEGSFTGSPTIAVSSTPNSGLTLQGTVAITTVVNHNDTLVAEVTDDSTAAPATVTFSNLEVNAPEGLGTVTAEVSIDNNDDCGAGLGSPGTGVLLPGNPQYDASPSGAPEIPIYVVGTPFGAKSNGAIYGSTSEQTAVAALEYQRPVTPGGQCLPNDQTPRPAKYSVGSTVVLTVDSNDGFDSLAASYLAGFYDTGVLLTEGAGDATEADGGSNTTVDPYTLGAIQAEGVTSVLIAGGPNAVSAQDMTQLENTPSYYCGGATERLNANGGVQDLQVQRIWGQTADATAAAVATYVDSGAVGQLNISGAFGQYNDTTGSSSAASPNLALRTAILATDLDSQDAESASALSYFEGIPLLLTPQASLGSSAETALLDLGIQQVIEPGGPLAISDAVNASLESQGISVLRVAGQDGSDTSVQLADFELNVGVNSHGQPEGLDWAPYQAWHGYINDAGTLTYGPFGGNCLEIEANGVTLPTDQNAENVAADSTDPGQLPADGGTNGYNFVSCSVEVALARGDFFADGVTSSVVTGHEGLPILLAESPSSLGTYVTGFFEAGGSPNGVDPVPFQGEITDDILPFGGPLALNPSTIQAALAAISAGANP